ncbi:alkaline phosphatase-like [Pollicipes pollicipes]|uniref:alkaline phosphatase-like n=1 Tax=Pollicipes pollicipes TaxID=41117 RepID=UPI001885858A|nr:alkaline phosphatase-like [Pollicipes pollicipes]
MKLFVAACLVALAVAVPLDSRVEDQDELEMHEMWAPTYQEVQEKAGLGASRATTLSRSGQVLDQMFWKDIAQDILRTKLADPVYDHQARNAVLFIGDGMSIPTLAAARKRKGLQHGADVPEHTMLSWETFPYLGLSKTYNCDRWTADSASTATAYLTGAKGNFLTVGVDCSVLIWNCDAVNEASSPKSILRYGVEAGKWVGLVSTARITHASPAATFGHTAYRTWESDADFAAMEWMTGPVKDSCKNVMKDLSTQFVEREGIDINVAFGGGWGKFTPKEVEGGSRLDGRDLIQEWKDKQESLGRSHAYISTKAELNSFDAASADYVLGLFSRSHMQYRAFQTADDVNLTEMVKKALEILKRGPNGFVLFVEGAKIDHGHHYGNAYTAIDETVELEEVVQYVMDNTDETDTLIVVSSDHSHTFSINGYPERGLDMFGPASFLAGGMQKGGPPPKLPYPIMQYANGPGGSEDWYEFEAKRARLADMSPEAEWRDPHYKQVAGIYLPKETHGGEDVGIFARGPGAHLLRGSLEENVIHHVINYALCQGDYATICDKK